MNMKGAMENNGIYCKKNEIESHIVNMMPKFRDYLEVVDCNGMMEKWIKFYAYSRN